MPNEIVQMAKALARSQRKAILLQFTETQLHEYLKKLFEAMEPNYTVAITHGRDELGKDLVIVKKDNISTEVFAIVVKIGDIRGTTSGAADEVKKKIGRILSSGVQKKLHEIESQVEQAFQHPAEIPTSFAKLPVSNVMVVLAGELSAHARKRLDVELKHAVTFRDIEWLIDNFTEHYPQIFYNEEALNSLQKKFQYLETRHVLSNKGINLSEYFVDPVVATIHAPFKLDEESIRNLVNRRRIPFMQLKSLLKERHRIVLVGDPISGKSGALAKLAIDLLKEASERVLRNPDKKEKVPIPLLVTAKEILGAQTAEALLANCFQASNLEDNFSVKILLVDALDEVSSPKRGDVITKAEAFARQFDSSLVIASRKIDIVKTPPEGFEKYELLPFEYTQAVQLCSKIVKNNEKALNALRDGIERISAKFPMGPLSLLFLIQLVEENKEIPASVSELYDRFFDNALGRWDVDKGLEVLFEYLIKKRFFASLAYEMCLKRNQQEISRREFEEFLKAYADRYNLEKQQVSDFVREIERTGIIDINDVVNFRHRTFLEYFAAFHVYDRREEFPNLDTYITDIYFDQDWGDIAFYYVGLKREISISLLDKIFSKPHGGIVDDLYKLLTGKLLQAGWNSPAATLRHGITKAIEHLPTLRDQILTITETAHRPIPRITADFIVMLMSDASFNSGLLFKEIMRQIASLALIHTKDEHYKMLALLWAIKRFLSQEELKKLINSFLGHMSNIPSLTAEDKVKSLIIMGIIEEKDKATAKSIKSHTDKMFKKYPEIFKGLLPPDKLGFRKAASKLKYKKHK